MNLRLLNLTIYVAALLAQAVVHAEMVGQAQPVVKPVRQAAIGAPLKLTPDEAVPNAKGVTDEPRIGKDAGQEPEVKKWLSEFDLVVVIDKAASKQTLTAYRNIGTKDNVILDAAMKTHVSTGVETRDCHFVKSMTPDASGMRWFTKVKAIYKHTPTGYYVPSRIDADHYSATYDASHMKNAVGWYADDGFWTHEHPPGTKAAIGQRASHGCVRMYADSAQDLFTMVLMTGGQFDPMKDDNINARCPQDPDSQVPCVPSKAADIALQAYFTKIQNGNYPYNAKDPKNVRDLKSHMPRLSPYATKPDVLVVKKNGELVTDPVTKENKRQPGYNTLYIVKDSDIDTPKETSVPPPITCPSVDEANAQLAQSQGMRAPANPGGFQPNGNNPVADFFDNLFNQNRPSQPVPPPTRQRGAGNR